MNQKQQKKTVKEKDGITKQNGQAKKNTAANKSRKTENLPKEKITELQKDIQKHPKC